MTIVNLIETSDCISPADKDSAIILDHLGGYRHGGWWKREKEKLELLLELHSVTWIYSNKEEE